ncbi:MULTISPECIES: spore coat protein U domain-containing protein [Ralstonia solanacearum species complex]|uniref:spore coat protein U domain-containing protein n=1 Tax=Ralstonia solanacearum species complex TaxID=3116862 RepID=UPI001F098438|nr:spore coat protein U domain-containing protein [Ralstonia solanacearum]
MLDAAALLFRRGPDFARDVGYALPNPGSTTCSSITSNPTTFSLSVSATLVSDCLISATNLNFGTAGVLTSALTASAITLNCTNQAPWTLALSAGSRAGATFSSRLLTRRWHADGRLVDRYGHGNLTGAEHDGVRPRVHAPPRPVRTAIPSS